MANQALTPKSVRSPLGGSKSDFISRIALALGVLVLVVITAISMGNSVANEVKSTVMTTSGSALPQDGRAYFTEPYWEMARNAESRAGIEIGNSPLPQDGRAYFTEPYWEMARNAESRAGVEIGNSPLPQDGRAFFTEPYWELGSVKKDEQPAKATEPEWSYYTEQYWGRTR